MSNRLTPDREQEIRAMAHPAYYLGKPAGELPDRMATAMRELLAEVDRLRAECQRLHNRSVHPSWAKVTDEMVERGARAIYGPTAWDQYKRSAYSNWNSDLKMGAARGAARAALEAALGGEGK